MIRDFLISYLTVVNLTSIEILLTLIAVDVLLGIIIALKAREFQIQKVADFLVSNGVPLIVYMALGFPAMLIPSLKDSLLGVGAILIAADTAMVIGKAGVLLGFQIPKIISAPTPTIPVSTTTTTVTSETFTNQPIPPTK